MKPFPKYTVSNLPELIEIVRYILKERRNDINDFENLKNVFISGRKVGKIPTGATDITNDDKVGDISYDASYLYIVVDNSGTAEWRRVALASW